MARRRFAGALALAAGLAVACGEIPTLADGVAYISAVALPAPAVAAGDQLRDSTGAVAPLRVLAFDRDGNLVAVTPTYVVTALPAGVSIDAGGVVTAADSVRSVQIVARVGERLQTPPITLEIVPQPDSLAAGGGALDSLVATRASSAISANVTGLRGGARVPVRGIIVRYQITAAYPARAITPALAVFDVPLAGDPTRSVDTTDTQGTASRAITPVVLTGVDSVEVRATALSLRGIPLKGSPLRFVLPVKRGS